MIFDGFGRNSLDCEGKKHVFVCFVFNLETCYMLANAMLICSLAFRVYFVCFIVGLNMLFFSLQTAFTANLEYYFPITIFHGFLVDAFFLIPLVSIQFARSLPMFVLFS